MKTTKQLLTMLFHGLHNKTKGQTPQDQSPNKLKIPKLYKNECDVEETKTLRT